MDIAYHHMGYRHRKPYEGKRPRGRPTAEGGDTRWMRTERTLTERWHCMTDGPGHSTLRPTPNFGPLVTAVHSDDDTDENGVAGTRVVTTREVSVLLSQALQPVDNHHPSGS